GRGTDELVSILTAVLAAARKRIWITNAYFAPRRRAIGRLAAAVRRGVDVRLLLPGASDVPTVQHAAHGYYRGLLEGGVRIFEYGAAILHAKSLVADDRVCVVGSTNLDYRSFHLNAECNLVIIDSKTADRLGRAFEEDLSRSREIRLEEWRRRGLGHQLLDQGARCLAPVL
ncbi:MAG TPA: phospholipase D-like domain-containing protein, partial [Thermoanaerobaculia bacterium]